MRSQILLALVNILLPFTTAQQLADGLLVPFTSTLPSCASQCGKISDVQGACVPPVAAEASKSCFCADPRLKAFASDGTSGVASVCTAASCTDEASLAAIQSWYLSFCNLATANPTTTTGGTSATGTPSPTTKPSPVKYQGW